MTRREFFVGATTLAVDVDASGVSAAMRSAATVPPRNPRPYSGIDWATVKEVHTSSHCHCTNQKMLDSYLKRDFEFLTLSNYYPSAPTMPVKTFRDRHYWVHHDFPVMLNGKRIEGPIDWNKIVGQWADQLKPERRAMLPFTEGELRFPNAPDNILEAPNAEHHWFTDRYCSLHLCAPGSAYASGTFDQGGGFKTFKHGYSWGCGEPVKISIRRMLDALIYPDGGGVTINHPSWSHHPDELIWDLLDFDPRVLGIEVYNMSKTYPWTNNNCEDYWDRTLSTGRQCFGFFVPDWGQTCGTNVLLVPEKTVHACLRAYRQGNWYGAIKGKGILRFTSIRFDGRHLKVTLDKPAHIQLITRRGISQWKNKAMEMSFSVSAGEEERYGYLRVRAYALDGSEEVVYTQPMMLAAGPTMVAQSNLDRSQESSSGWSADGSL